MECRALEDRHVWVAGVARLRRRNRQHGRDGQAVELRAVGRRVGARAADDPQRRVPGPRRRGRARAEPRADRERPGLPCRGRAGRRADGDAEHGPPDPVAARSPIPRPGLARRSLGAGPVRHRGTLGFRDRPRAAGARCGRLASALRARVHRRRGRRRECEPPTQQVDQPRPLAGRAAIAPDHVRAPADRVRRDRRGRSAGAARVLGGAGRGRPCGGREPSRARLRRHHLGDAADGNGGRDRLLALLPQARARGAQRRARGRARARRGHGRPCRARLRPHRPGRDGGDAAVGDEGVRLDRSRRDPGGGRRADRLADGAAGAARAGSATRSTRDGSAGRARPRGCGMPCSVPCCASRWPPR